MNRIKSFSYHLKTEFIIGFRNKSILFINYFLPLFFYLMMGFVMGEINESFKEYMKVSMIIFAIMTSTLLTVPNEVVFARSEGIYRSYKIYGISRLEIILHYTINSLLHCLVTGTVIFFTSGILFDANPISSLPIMLLAIFLFFLANMGICLLISMFFQIPKVAGLIAQSVFIPSILAGGIIIPLDTLPTSLTDIVAILPSTHVMNIFQLECSNLQSSAIGYTTSMSLIILAIIIIITYGVALLKFKYNNK